MLPARQIYKEMGLLLMGYEWDEMELHTDCFSSFTDHLVPEPHAFHSTKENICLWSWFCKHRNYPAHSESEQNLNLNSVDFQLLLLQVTCVR